MKTLFSFKIFGRKINIIRGENHNCIFGILCCLLGIGISSLIVIISGFYNIIFWAVCAFLSCGVILIRFEKNWDKLIKSIQKKKK